MRDRAYVAGIPVRRAALADAAQLISADAQSGRGQVYVLVNAHSSKLRRESAEYAAVISDTSRAVGLADGASVTLAAKLIGHGDIGRSPGPDLLEACSDLFAADGTPIFLLGGAEGVADALAGQLAKRHPGLRVVGTATPPFGEWSEDENLRLAEAVRNSGARILWMGVSAPKQEVWAYRFVDALSIPTVCVGAAFDFSTGAKKRAPRWMRRIGLEWIHRLLSEPGRMWKRYLVGNTLFIVDVVRYRKRPCSHRATE